MDYNTEELLREDFDRVAELNRQIRDGAGPDIGHNVEHGRRMAASERDIYVNRWATGEHAARWAFLNTVYEGLENSRAETIRFYGDVHSRRNTRGLDAFDQRSVTQAGVIVGRSDPELCEQLLEAAYPWYKREPSTRKPVERRQIERGR